MADLLFKCTKCSSNLVVESTVADQTLPCSACQQPVRVPEPAISFRCGKCQHDLCAPRLAAGASFACPECGTDVVVPPRTQHQLKVLRTAAKLTDTAAAIAPAATEPPPATGRQCPQCGGAVPANAILCRHCGVNLMTNKAAGRPAPSRATYYIGVALLLVSLTAGGWFCRDYHKQATQQRNANMAQCRMLCCDSTKIALFDALTLLSLESPHRIAIDPDVAESIARIRIEIAELPNATDPGLLTEFLIKHHLVIHKCPVSEKCGRFVYLVTTESIWAYNQASRLLQSRQLDKGYQVLNETTTDSSAFGLQCQKLRSLLANLKDNQNELAKLATQVKEATASCVSNYKSAQAASHSARNQLKGGIGQANESFTLVAEARYAQSSEDLHAATRHIRQFANKMALGNQAIWLRHLEAQNTQLNSESLALLDIMIENSRTLQSLGDEIEKAQSIRADLPPSSAQSAQSAPSAQPANIPPVHEQPKLEPAVDISKALSELPALLPAHERMLKESVRFSSDRLNAIFTQGESTTEVADGLAFANEAFASDHGNLPARAALGYFRAQWQAKAATDLFRNKSNRGTAPYEELAREFRDKRKTGMLDAALEYVGHTNTTTRIDSNGRLRPTTEAVADFYRGIIEPLARDMLARLSATFNDTGKDAYAGLSTNETNTSTAIASVCKQPIRLDVAMLGSFRSDGSVQPVRNIFEKVAAAVAAPLVEIAILPKGNEDDGTSIPIDKLCRIALISGEDIQIYIKYATDAKYNLDALTKLRTAQVLILGSEWERAESLLVEVAAECPEIYSARRLLELIALWRKTGLSKYKYNNLWPAVSAALPAAEPMLLTHATPIDEPPATRAEPRTLSTPPAPSPTIMKPVILKQSGKIHRIGQ